MMRALFSGVSGLANQQLKMDVIGNNISNISTVGFKGSRINFQEALSQVLRGAQDTSSAGSQNAVLVGLGVATGTIERNFSQGILQSTGKLTDLGLQGDGFFVVNDGTRQLYTRAGNFHFDGKGRLVTANGALVQGWTANQTGELSQTASLGDIVFDASVISPAAATKNVAIAGNLDATAVPVREVWTASKTFLDANTGNVADGTTEINDLVQTTTPLVDGDTIIVGGTNFDGSPVSATFTYGAGNDGTTLADLISVIDSAFSGTVTLENGQIVLRDFNFGESSTTITLAPGSGNTGVIELPGFVNTAKGFSPKTSTSVEVFDSLGSKHTLNMTFTKTENPREWSFEVSFPGSESVVEGGKGTVTFAGDGSLETILYNQGQSLLVVDPGNGAENISINLDFENTTGLSGLTQFAGSSAVSLPFQDGQAKGTLTAFSIDESGQIIGAFSNGRTRLIAQLALANVKNPEGLIHIGNNLYDISASSGIPVVGKAGEDVPATVLSGTLEASNVDLAQEFAEMIIAQRAFQANARVITVSDQFLSEVTQLKR